MKLICIRFALLSFAFLVGLVSLASVAWAQGADGDGFEEDGFSAEVEYIRPHLMLYTHPLTFYPRYEKNEDQNLSLLNIQMFGLGVDFVGWTLQFEYSRFSTDSRSGNMKIERTQNESIFWGQYQFLDWKKFNFYLGFGLGSYDENIKTTVGALTSEDHTQWNWMAGASLAVSRLVWKYVFVSAEGRAIYGKDLDPQPQLGGALKVGFYY